MLNPFKRVKLTQVFTPSSIAKLTYVNRSTLEGDVEKFLETPGMQLVLYGHSGCGKSTLIINKLEKLKIRYIKTSCENRTTLDELILQAFDRLDVFYENERTSKLVSSAGGKFGVEYKLIKSEISSSITQESGNKHARVLPVQLTAQRLSGFMGAIGCIWIIEDFHKVKSEEKKKIADVIKVFTDASFEYPAVKIVCIGAVGTARELVELDSNLSSRVAEVFVPLLSGDELVQIPKAGFKLLNIECHDSIIQKIAHYSNQLASVCHQICYDICHGKGMRRGGFFKTKVDDTDFTNSVHSYVRKNSDTIAKIYDKCTACDMRKRIISVVVRKGKEEFTLSELNLGSRGKSESDWSASLSELNSVDYNEVLRFDANSQKYSFSNPFFLAFTKMKMAIERQERAERFTKANRRNNLLLKPRVAQLTEEAVLEQVIQEMNTLYAKRISDIEQIYMGSNKLR
jgi:hypothetical protein